MTVSGTQDTTSSPLGMRFCVDAWDVSYGTALAVEDLPASVARVETDVETPTDQWAPIPIASDVPHPSAVLFVDGVRRIDARVWIDDSPAPSPDTTNALLAAGMAATASMAVCASYAAGVVCCCGQPRRRQAHLVAAEIRRGLFTTAAHATDIPTRGGTYRARHAVGSDTVPLTMTLSNALQQALAEIEVITALAARAALPRAAEHAGSPPRGQDGADDDLLVIDGPLRNRTPPAPHHRANQVPPGRVPATRAEPDRRRAYRRATHPRVPDGHYLGTPRVVPAAPIHPGRARRAMGRCRTLRSSDRPVPGPANRAGEPVANGAVPLRVRRVQGLPRPTEPRPDRWAGEHTAAPAR